MNLLEFARMELDNKLKNSDYDEMLKNDIMKLIEVFSSQGHSGSSAYIVSNVAYKLMNFEALSPLTGDDEEWGEPHPWCEQNTQQNKRNSEVFRKNFNNDEAYDISRGIRVISFPYEKTKQVEEE